MAVNKVELISGEVLMDLTEDTVTPETLAEGATAHGADGEAIVGTMRSGGSADWSVNDPEAAGYVKNRTHWLERAFEPIEWDGDIEGRDSIDNSLWYGAPAGASVLYKISDQVLDVDTLSAANGYCTIGAASVPLEIYYPTQVVDGVVWFCQYNASRPLGDSYEDFAGGDILLTAISGDFTDTLGVVVPSAGTYARQGAGGYGLHTLHFDWDTYHKLPAEFLPDTVATKDYVDDVPFIVPSYIEPNGVPVYCGHSCDIALPDGYFSDGDGKTLRSKRVGKILLSVDGSAPRLYRVQFSSDDATNTHLRGTVAVMPDDLTALVVDVQVLLRYYLPTVTIYVRKLLTDADMGTIAANVIASLPIYNGEVIEE